MHPEMYKEIISLWVLSLVGDGWIGGGGLSTISRCRAVVRLKLPQRSAAAVPMNGRRVGRDGWVALPRGRKPGGGIHQGGAWGWNLPGWVGESLLRVLLYVRFT